MKWVDTVSRRIGEKVVKRMSTHDVELPDIKQDLATLEELRQQLIEKDEELNETRLIWDRTFDSIIDQIVLINREGRIYKANTPFYSCVENNLGHVEFEGMLWSNFRSMMGIPSDNCVVERCLATGVHQERMLYINGKYYHATANPIYTETENGAEIIGVVRVSRDVTKEEKDRERLKRRSNIYNAISEMSKTLVNHEDWNSAVNLILGELGRSIGASRVYVFQNTIREDRICALLQSVYSSTPSQRKCNDDTMTQCLNYDLLPEWQSRMEHGLSVEGNLVDCNLCNKKDDCMCSNEVLVCAVPIFVDKKWWGFIGFDYINGTRVWKDEDETLLRIAADILGGVIYHRCRYWDTVSVLEECEDKLKDDMKK